MDTKLINNIKKYFTRLWSVEIIVVIVIGMVLLISYINEFNTYNASIGINSFNAIFEPDKVVKGLIKKDSYEVAKAVYEVTDDLKNVKEDVIEGNVLNRYGVLYVILNKENNQIITNSIDMKKLRDENKNVLTEDKLYVRLMNVGYTYQLINNKNNFNSYVDKNKFSPNEKANLEKYTEFYFVPTGTYNSALYEMKLNGIFLMILSIIEIIMCIKITAVLLLYPKEIINKINIVKKIIYVLSNGFLYKHSNRKLKIALVSTIAIIIGYLYLVAGDKTENIIISFLGTYPFKGTLVIILIPLLCLIYSLKKTVDIDVINNLLGKVKEGDLELNIEYYGENEIAELVENINEIKKGYKIAVDERVKNEKLKTDLISNISHDLKTPLTSIVNYVNILKTQELSEEEKKEYLDILETKSSKLKVLIEDLFEITKLNSGKMRAKKQDIDVVSLIHMVVGESSYLYEHKNINFKITSSSEELNLSLDGVLISRLFENVAINALKYSLPNTRVYVDIVEKEKYVEIAFKNTANYEMQFDKEEIFEKFVRADESRNSSIEGSGIGLAIAKSIVELHEGTINIEMEGDMFKLFINIPKVQ